MEAQRAYFERGLEIFTELSKTLTDPNVRAQRSSRAIHDDDAGGEPKADLQRKISKAPSMEKKLNLMDDDLPSSSAPAAAPVPTPKPKPPTAVPVAAPKPAASGEDIDFWLLACCVVYFLACFPFLADLSTPGIFP